MITTEFVKDFPNVITHTSSTKIKNHPLFESAKNGDLFSCARLVSDLLKVDRVDKLKELYPNAIIVPVMGIEDNKNKIPLAMARAINRLTGLEVETRITKNNLTQHTNKGALERFLSRASFEGVVQKEKDYIIVDDVVTQGGSLNELRNFIQENGGRVVAASTLGYTQFATELTIKKEMIEKIERKFGRYETEELIKGIGVGTRLEHLTNSEGRLLTSFSSLDRIRERISEIQYRYSGRISQRDIQQDANRGDRSKENTQKVRVAEDEIKLDAFSRCFNTKPTDVNIKSSLKNIKDEFIRLQDEKNKLTIEEDKFEKGKIYFDKLEDYKGKFKEQLCLYEAKIKELGFLSRDDYEKKLKDFSDFKVSRLNEISSKENQLKELNRVVKDADFSLKSVKHKEIIDLYKDECHQAPCWDMNTTYNIQRLNENEGRIVSYADIEKLNVENKDLAKLIVQGFTREIVK